MEFTINDFSIALMEMIVNSKYMPNMNGAYTNKYGYTQLDSSKHSKRPEPRDLKHQIANSMSSSRVVSENTVTFDIGNEMLEKNFPYYHILQQAPVIRKRNKGTDKSKGSQMFVKDKGKRDYEQVYWNGKTFTKEYSKNVRGSRINLNKTSMHIDGQFINMEQNQYLNMHYRYIDNILNNDVVDQIALKFNLKRKRTEDSGLIDEFAMQEGTEVESVLKAFEGLI